MIRPFARRTLLLATTALILAGCAETPWWNNTPAPVSLTDVAENGVTIASSGVDSGQTILGATGDTSHIQLGQAGQGPQAGANLATLLGAPVDCAGTPLLVSTHSVGNSQKVLLDNNGEPCSNATVMYDGHFARDQRSADPAIQIGMPQVFGTKGPTIATRIADNAADLPELPALPAIRVQAEPLGKSLGKSLDKSLSKAPKSAAPAMATNINPAEGQVEGQTDDFLPPVALVSKPLKRVSATPSDHLSDVLASWKKTPATPDFATDNGGPATDDATAAAARQLDHAVTRQRNDAMLEQSAQLLSQLREKERQLQEEQRRHAETQAQALQQKNATAAMLSSFQQQQAQTEQQLNTTRDQLQTAEAANQHLSQVKQQQQQAYTAQVQNLSKDLKASEQQASTSRNELVLAAAQKIAEAETLANAARLAEADATAREAARKKQEGEDMLQRALDLKNNQAVIVANLAPSQPAEMALLEVPVVLHVKDQPLATILDEILRQAKGQAGNWQADWQLTAAQHTLLEDKWSLTAEAPVSALLQNLTAQVKAARGVTLKFTQFPQSRLVVVTAEANNSATSAAAPSVPVLPVGVSATTPSATPKP